MATPRPRVATAVDKNNVELVASLKFRVKELEEEVSTLKGRLDDLRRAKNTTITKREREIVEVGFPKRDPKYEAKLAELQKQLKDLERDKNKEIEDLRLKHSAELDDAKSLKNALQRELDELRKKLAGANKDLEELRKKQATLAKDVKEKKQPEVKPCNHEDEIAKLKTKITGLEGDNAALMVENSDLKERVSSLVSELSVKEAQWCEEEEKLKLKIKEGWGERYQQWMVETEKKIEELQEANTILRTYLHRSGRDLPPDGRLSGDGTT